MAKRTKALAFLADHFIFEGSNPVRGYSKNQTSFNSSLILSFFRFLFCLNLKSNSGLLNGVN